MELSKTKLSIVLCFSLTILIGAAFSCYKLFFWFEKNIYAKSICCNQNSLTLYEDEYFNDLLNIVKIQPENSNQIPQFIPSVNSKIIIDLKNYRIKGLSTGTDIILIKVNSAKNEQISTSITVNILPKRIFATSLGFELANITMFNNQEYNNKLIIGGIGVNQIPTITYSNENIVNYDYLTGNIVPMSIGSTTITASINVSAKQKISSSFNVQVTESKEENVEILGNLTAFNNSVVNTKFIRLNYELKLDGKTCDNQDINIEILENSLEALLEEDEFMTALFIYVAETGKLKLKLTTNLNNTYEKIVEIVI